MALARSRVTSQGQISVPKPVRDKLGIAPGAILEWVEDHDNILVRKAGIYSSADIRRMLFPGKKPRPHSLAELKEGIRQYIRKKHARD